MKNYLEELIKIIPKENKGYNYISTIDISIPISVCKINAIKRKETGLQLLEEIIMKLIGNEVNTIVELSQILGVSEEIIEETIGILNVRNCVIVTAGNCILSSKGENVLKTLKETKLEQEIIEPIYINLLTGEIYTDKYNNQTDKYIKKDNVLNGRIKIDLDYINGRFGEVKDIFDIQQKTFGANKLSSVNLYKIESIDENKIQYINVLSYLYKNKTGEEIEIISPNSIIERIQSEIFEQMINQYKFKYIFKNRNINEIISDNELEDKHNYNNDNIKLLIRKYNKANKDEKQIIEEQFYKIYKQNRCLLDNEVGLMINELSAQVKEIKIYINKLSDILFDDEYILPLSKSIKKGAKVIIYYNYENNLEKTLLSSKRSFPEINNISIIQEETKFKNLVANFDNIYEINTEYYDVKVFGNKYITKSISNIVNI